MDIGEDKVAVDGDVEQGDLDDAHDDQQLGDESRERWHTGQGHHEDEHGSGEERFPLGEAAKRFECGHPFRIQATTERGRHRV